MAASLGCWHGAVNPIVDLGENVVAGFYFGEQIELGGCQNCVLSVTPLLTRGLLHLGAIIPAIMDAVIVSTT